MTPHKYKVEKTVQAPEVTTLKGFEGSAFRIQAVYYSSENPSSHLYIYDKDGDPVTYPITGEMHPHLLDVKTISAKLPLRILDETGGNSVIIYGEVYRPNMDA